MRGIFEKVKTIPFLLNLIFGLNVAFRYMAHAVHSPSPPHTQHVLTIVLNKLQLAKVRIMDYGCVLLPADIVSVKYILANQ